MKKPVQSSAEVLAAVEIAKTAVDEARRCGRSWVEIEPEALRRNWRRIVANLPENGFAIACLKKQAYGHGFYEVLNALVGERAFWGVGVATLDEVTPLELAHAWIFSPAKIGPAPVFPNLLPFLMLAPLTGAALEEAVRLGVTLTVTTFAEAQEADSIACKLECDPDVHFKVDTGMGRLGLLPDEAAAEFRKIRELPCLCVEAVFSHLADGWKDPDSRAGQRQSMARFLEVAGLGTPESPALPVHWGGSDALAFSAELPPGSGLRVGIALYGDHPAADFEPAMTFKTRIVYRRRVPAGTAISYGSTFTTRRETELAVIGAGYGNGLLRALSNKGEVLIAGRRSPILGRVCMDQCVVDVTDSVAAGLPIGVGDEAVIFGKQTLPGGETVILPAAEQAARAGTISYELFCLAGTLNPRFLISK